MYYKPPPRGIRYGRAPVPPHARVPSSLGRDVPGGWHGRPYRPATHPLIDHPDRVLEAGFFYVLRRKTSGFSRGI